MEKFQQIKELNAKSREVWLDYYLNEILFSMQWWIIILSFIIPYIIFWKLVDKSRIKEILFVGVVIGLLSFLLDQIGAGSGLWTYHYTLTPLEREIWDPADFAIIPVFYMLIYQWFQKWKSYIYAHIVFAFFGAYIGGNIFQWLGIYELLKWKHIYSVPIYFIMGIFIKWLVLKLNRIQNNTD
jgi:hypothetical protein